MAVSGETIAFGITDTTITIPQIFGRSRQFYLQINPQKAEFETNHSAWDSFCQGVILGLPNWEQYRTASFVPNQPDKLLLRVGSDFEFRQMPDFKLIQKLDISPSDAIICNIDPATGNLLYLKDDFLKVAHVDNLANSIFEIRSYDASFCRMFNNKILTYGQGGIVFDISPYINQ